MNISLRQLRAFLAVAETGSFSRAGEQVSLTQPAISRHVTELEQALGVQLLHRTTRTVEVSDAGRLLCSHMRRVLEDLDASLLEVQGLGSHQQGRVRVASSPTLSAHLLPQCIARCHSEAPAIHIKLLDRIQHDVLQSVRSAEVDFGVVIDPQDVQDLHTTVISQDPFCLVCPASHPLASHRQVHWRALCGEALVLLDHASGSRRLIDAALQAHGAAASVVQDVGHTATIYSMVQAGLGVSVVPQLAVPIAWMQRMAHPQQSDLVSRPLMPLVERSIMLVHRQYRALSPVAQRVWDMVATEAGLLGTGR